MKISKKQYAQALFEVVKDLDKKNAKKAIKKFADILVKNNKVSQVDGIITYFTDFWNKDKSIVNAEIVSSRKLGRNIVQAINSYVVKISNAKNVEVKEKIDEKIIGGVIVRHSDKILDMSLRNRLALLRNSLKE
jgi:F-type H+-transporting ATPase subunit delta